MATVSFPAANSPEHEAAARACDEAGWRRVAGRPACGQLNPRCGYDLGMIEVAYAESRLALEKKAAAIAPGPRPGPVRIEEALSMSALHHVRVRRARGLPMPLPPKPKRPLGPPVLLYWGDTRSRCGPTSLRRR